jgi:hypothetical protein
MKDARTRGLRPGPKPKLSRQQSDHARKLMEVGQRCEDVAHPFKVGRTTLYRALAGYHNATAEHSSQSLKSSVDQFRY